MFSDNDSDDIESPHELEYDSDGDFIPTLMSEDEDDLPRAQHYRRSPLAGTAQDSMAFMGQRLDTTGLSGCELDSGRVSSVLDHYEEDSKFLEAL